MTRILFVATYLAGVAVAVLLLNANLQTDSLAL
jgi:hypothetical protein